jgi:hypothetical protein
MKDKELRDFFAASALQGLLANGWNLDQLDWVPSHGAAEIARDAYAIADAMIEARAEKKPQE